MENVAFYDCEEDIAKLLVKINKEFDDRINTDPPYNENLLAPIGYTGFRWVSQLDPLWNAYFLGLVLSIANQIEACRISTQEECIFSYRYDENVFLGFCWVFFSCSGLKFREG